MADNLVIDKQSKLFQKFIQNKTQKDQRGSSLAGNQLPQGVDHSHAKENLMDAANLLSNQKENNQINCLRETKESKSFSLKGSEHQMEKIQSIHRYQRCVNSSLNTQGALGLDKILKRAIEKVRNSKIQELYQKKKERAMEEDDSLQKLTGNTRRKQLEQTCSTQSNLSQREGKEVSKCLTVSAKNKLTNTAARQQISKQSCQSIKQQEVIAKLKAQVSDLKQKLKEEKERSDALKVEISKLQREINLEIDLHHQTKQERQQLIKQLNQLDKFTSDKEKQLKKHSDDANYWRTQHQLLTINTNTLKDTLKLLQKKIQVLKNQNDDLRKEKAQKQQQFLQLKIEEAKMTQETKLAKQYLYQLTIKLYNYQKEIKSLKGEASDEIDFGSRMNTEVQSKQENVQSVAIYPVTRKRQFSRERSVTSFKPDSSRADLRQKKAAQPSTPAQIPTISHIIQSPVISETDITRQAKVAMIKAQLQQLNDCKIVNGKIRRRRIQLERELEQFLK